MNGVLLVDKPRGPTSHDVVHALRRTLGTKRVGHAGTLDPAATGLLVVLVGEATKLEPYFSACDKAYVADVMLGRSTDTLDLEGAITGEVRLDAPEHRALHDELLALEASRSAAAPRIRAALAHELTRTEQVPPAFSAIKVDGKRSHARARSGEQVELPARAVRVAKLGLEAVRFDGPWPILTIELDVSKGYYVRSFARDLGGLLGVPSTLAGLRRTRSGDFTLASAAAATADKDELASRLIGLVDAATALMPRVLLTEEGVLRARQGKSIRVLGDLAAPAPEAISQLRRVALVTPDGGALVAIAEIAGDSARVLRGFVPPP
ncbi:MAG TPA: tRNA pseudouridine(55) synthase TruB [Polyangiaceae bacterium]|nr:tRNA pseudouridine(55) synthase TruB [Polyangiaceae bacterium]